MSELKGETVSAAVTETPRVEIPPVYSGDTLYQCVSATLVNSESSLQNDPFVAFGDGLLLCELSRREVWQQLAVRDGKLTRVIISPLRLQEFASGSGETALEKSISPA